MAINTGLRTLSSWADLAVSGNDVYALTVNGFVHKLNADGNSWTVMNTTAVAADSFTVEGQTIYAYLFLGTGLFRSTNGGATFAPVNLGTTVLGAYGVAARGNRVLFSAVVNNQPRVLSSLNGGESFTVSQSVFRPYGFDFIGDTLYGFSDVMGVFFSTNNGVNWTPLNAGLPTSRVFVYDLNGESITLGLPGYGFYQATNPHTQAASLASVSAASYASNNEFAPESIGAAFGAALATATLAASTTPLPTTLGGTRILVRDSAGVERNAPLFFVSSGQINFQVPPGTATGAATVMAFSSDGQTAFGAVTIANVAPGLFAANANGQGLAAALALRIKADGVQGYEPVADLNAATSQFVARPLELGPESDQVFLVLFGTGLRARSNQTAVTALIGGTDAPVLYAGAQGALIGTDQINVRLPRSLIGRGEVEIVLTVDGKTSNTVKVAIR